MNDDTLTVDQEEVLRAGYRCRGRLLRPAMVRVDDEPAGASSEG